MTTADAPTSRRALRGSRPRRRGGIVSGIVGVIGELLLTAGVLVLLFLGWKLWYNDLVVGEQQGEAARELAEDWEAPGSVEPAGGDYGDPVISEQELVAGEAFALLYVPRFGEDWVRTIGESTDLATVLNSTDLGVGHYVETQRPGEEGNFALAAHRQTHGGAFYRINELQVGDEIIVRTQEGVYVYEYRTTEYVTPQGVDVLDPVPQAPEIAPEGDRYITLTSCNPLFSTAERIVAYGVLTEWYPAGASDVPEDVAEILGA